MDHLNTLYVEHLQKMQQRVSVFLEKEPYSHLVLHSGLSHYFFKDDHGFPFKLNPYFNAWMPLELPSCWLVVDGVHRPKLILFREVDFWHKSFDMAEIPWLEHVDLHVIDDHQQAKSYLPQNLSQVAFIGEAESLAATFGFKEINPSSVLHYLNYYRGYKTPFEMACLRLATDKAVLGHKAVEAAIVDLSRRATEFDLNQIYLQATEQEESQLPYRAIIAQNENAAVLHYQHRMRSCPEKLCSLLIDAGVQTYGYAADISRTYAYEPGLFADMIVEMDRMQRALMDGISIGQSYSDLHDASTYEIARLLKHFELVNTSVEQMVEENIVHAFFPHGLGHLLGIQVHDVGERLISPYLEDMPKSSKKLRNHRLIEQGQVMTIEPGLYFIDQLLLPFKKGQLARHIDWSLVDHLMPYGGIRIEDNIIINEQEIENLTRQAGLHTARR